MTAINSIINNSHHNSFSCITRFPRGNDIEIWFIRSLRSFLKCKKYQESEIRGLWITCCLKFSELKADSHHSPFLLKTEQSFSCQMRWLEILPSESFDMARKSFKPQTTPVNHEYKEVTALSSDRLSLLLSYQQLSLSSLMSVSSTLSCYCFHCYYHHHHHHPHCHCHYNHHWYIPWYSAA